MTRLTRKVTWLTMGPEPYLATCQRCGEHVDPPPLPTPLEAFVKYLEYGLAAHEHCLPQEPWRLLGKLQAALGDRNDDD